MKPTPALDLVKLKKSLLLLREETELALQQLQTSGKTVNLDQNRVGRLSRMDALQGQAIAKASSARQTALLKSIDTALIKIKAGAYGRCRECDEWIALARLELDPSTDYCITCAQSME